MAIYEYECPTHSNFERLRPMSESSESSSCPDCGKESGRIFSSTHFRMAEPFRVVDSQGNVTQEKQVLNNTPDWREQKPIEYSDKVPKPIISRGGNVYYPRKQRETSNATS